MFSFGSNYVFLIKFFNQIFILVTRSQTRHIRRYKIKECFVAIAPSLGQIAQQWLQSHQPHQPPQAQTAPVQPAPPTVDELLAPITVDQVTAIAQVPAPRHARRASIASGHNLFEVDGSIREVGFDHLQRVPLNHGKGNGTVSNASSNAKGNGSNESGGDNVNNEANEAEPELVDTGSFFNIDM